MNTIIIEPEFCDCDECWKVFCALLNLKDPEFVEGFANKFRATWRGLPVAIHDMGEKDDAVHM